MTILMRLFLVLGMAFVVYGLARWQVMTEVVSKQRAPFEQFIGAHSAESTNGITVADVDRLRRRVRLCLGFHTGWPQAVPFVALGLMFFAITYYLGAKRG